MNSHPQGTGSREEKKSVLAKLRDGSVQQAAVDPYRIHAEYIHSMESIDLYMFVQCLFRWFYSPAPDLQVR